MNNNMNKFLYDKIIKINIFKNKLIFDTYYGISHTNVLYAGSGDRTHALSQQSLSLSP